MDSFLYGANVRANGIRQHYLRFGGHRGLDPVILIPGITSPAITWAFVAKQLGAHLDCYVLDVRGRGLSESGADLDYSLDAQAADLIAFAHTLGLQRYSVLGHSMGARIAIRAARQHPIGMMRLVLADPPVSGPNRRPYPAELKWYLESIAMAQQGCDAEAMRAYLPGWSDEHLRLRAEWLHTCEPAAITASFEGFHEDDIHADVPHINIPVRLLAAEHGDVIRDVELTELQQLNPLIQAVRVRHAGHMLPWDHALNFYAALGDFLGCHVTTTAPA